MFCIGASADSSPALRDVALSLRSERITGIIAFSQNLQYL